ncbi:MAG: hypothetical protein ABSE82_05105 [Nitrososphaerales archaeon]
MKLTKRGKEFLIATIAGTIVASVVDITIILALCLSLVFAAVLSEIMLIRSSSDNIGIERESSHVSCFKGEKISCKLIVHSGRRRFVKISLSKLVPPQGVDAEIAQIEQSNFNLQFKPRFSGRFFGLSALFELNDPLQLFKKTIEFNAADFYVDCYPDSILREIATTRPLSVSLGELQGSSHGAGSEFYAVDEYRGMTDSKNIFWNKVASMPDERLLVKMRVANIQKTISLALLNSSERGQDTFAWIDSVCEGVGSIGKATLQIGCNVEIRFDSMSQVTTRFATDLHELSEAIMEMSTSHLSNLDNASSLLAGADICITGFKELQNELLASVVARKPALLIEDTGVTPNQISELSIIYSPYKNLSALVNRVAGI